MQTDDSISICPVHGAGGCMVSWRCMLCFGFLENQWLSIIFKGQKWKRRKKNLNEKRKVKNPPRGLPKRLGPCCKGMILSKALSKFREAKKRLSV